MLYLIIFIYETIKFYFLILFHLEPFGFSAFLAVGGALANFCGIESNGSEVQLLKAFSPIEVTEEGIVICVNDEQPSKAPFPIEVTEEGISNVICVNDEHPEKALFSIEATEEGIVICANDEQPEKA